MRIGVLASVGHMVDSFFSDIIASWTNAGHEVLIAAGTGTADGSGRVIEGLTRRPGAGAMRAWSGIRSWAQEDDLDVILTNTATASALARTAWLPIPVVYFCHGLHWNEGRKASDRLWQLVEGALLLKTSGVITINSDDHAWFSKRMPAQRILRLPAGVGLRPESYPRVSPPSAEGGAHGDILRLAWIGEFSTRKRPQLALDVADCLRREGVNFTLQMVGEGALLESVNDAIVRRRLEKHVAAEGTGNSAQVLADSHALIHTSAWEGLPRVMMEALAVGRPTYAFDVKGVRDIPHAVLFQEREPHVVADQLAADWRAGSLLEPLAFDPATLDVSRSAEAIRVFLEETVSTAPKALKVRSRVETEPAGTPTVYETT